MFSFVRAQHFMTWSKIQAYRRNFSSVITKLNLDICMSLLLYNRYLTYSLKLWSSSLCILGGTVSPDRKQQGRLPEHGLCRWSWWSLGNVAQEWSSTKSENSRKCDKRIRNIPTYRIQSSAKTAHKLKPWHICANCFNYAYKVSQINCFKS